MQTGKKEKGRKKYYLAIFNNNQLCQVLYTFIPEEILTLSDQYRVLGYRVEEGFLQHPEARGLITWRPKGNHASRKKTGLKVIVDPEQIKQSK